MSPRTITIVGCRLKLAPTQDEPCHCQAYPFPHRLGGGKCLTNPLNETEEKDDEPLG